MMKLILDNLASSRIEELENSAAGNIHIRGYKAEYAVPVDYRNPDWFVPFNQIPIKYCPTDRYAYLHKYKKMVKRQQTWESLTGKILDDTYEKFIKNLHTYLNDATLKNTDIMGDFQGFCTQVCEQAELLIKTEQPNIINFPEKESKVEEFKKLLKQILRYESQIASAMLDYKISIIKSINLSSMQMLLFPFVPKPSYTVTDFGISNNTQPDFLFDNKIIVDIKSPPWNVEYLNTLGGYALIYEKMNNRNMNLGMIVTPEFSNNRNVPHFFNSQIVLIEDIYRKSFLLRREKLLEQMKDATDPGIPESDEKCKSCGYFNHCWSSS